MKLFAARLPLVALGAVMLSSIGIFASQQTAASVPELFAGSETVVVAHVESVSSLWQENDHGDRIIVSRILLRVEETLKGSPAMLHWMEVPGGTLDGLTLHVSSLPSLTAGERGIFFLEQRSGQAFKTPRLRGEGILELDDNDKVRGSSVRLDDIRSAARQSGN